LTRLPKGADPAAFEAARAALATDAPVPRLIELASGSKAARRGVAAAIEDRTEIRAALADLGGGDPTDAPERLLRRALRRDRDAQIRTNPIVRNDAFACGHCGFNVPPGDGFVRNHCPQCLRSAHVDGDVPGDRASSCGGLMDPVASETKGGLWIVTHRCRRCGRQRRNRLYPDVASAPDRLEELHPPGV
jgi:hypothetical protein